ncbi:MAG TPA: dTMP kinase [Candidatus Baltobacteraceae bacterium]|nr:dTMP kinase [Candidatus Baltobacteraceae bacterium]
MTFITVEGIEGCGKSTLVAGLSERLRARGREIIVTREPGGTPAGDAIRRIFLEPDLAIAPLTEALLINAARAEHVVELIGPALRGGAIVLCDRFVDSTLAYQGYGRGIDLTFLRGLCEAAAAELVPDLTFVLDVPVAISRERTALRNGIGCDRMEGEDEAFFERVRSGYLELARGQARYRVLDATKAPEELAAQALAAIDGVLV